MTLTHAFNSVYQKNFDYLNNRRLLNFRTKMLQINVNYRIAVKTSYLCHLFTASFFSNTLSFAKTLTSLLTVFTKNHIDCLKIDRLNSHYND